MQKWIQVDKSQDLTGTNMLSMKQLCIKACLAAIKVTSGLAPYKYLGFITYLAHLVNSLPDEVNSN